MGIVRVLIFASLVAGTLGFFWPKFGQENEEIRPWDLADQMEEAARLEELCQQDDPYCFSTYIQYTVSRTTHCFWRGLLTKIPSVILAMWLRLFCNAAKLGMDFWTNIFYNLKYSG